MFYTAKQTTPLLEQTKKRTNTKFLVKLLLFFLLFFVFSSADIFGKVTPCNFGIFVSICLLDRSIFVISVSYLFSAFLTGVSSWELVFSFITIFLTCLVAIYNKIKKKTCSTYLILALCAFLGLINCVLNYTNLYVFALNAVFNTISSLCFLIVYKVFKYRKLNLKMQPDEIICFCFVLSLFFCGINSLNVFVFDVVKFLGLTLIMFLTFVLPLSGVMLMAVASGLGAGLLNGNVGYIVLFSLIAAINYIFKNQNKILICVTTFCVDLCVILFFNLFNLPIYYAVLPTISACIIFLIVSKKQVENIKNLIFIEDNTNLKNVFDNDKMFLYEKLLLTSEVFYEMDKNFRGLLHNKIDEKTSKLLVCNEILRENCENCENRIKCVKNFDKEIRNVFQGLTNIGFEKGKITLLDLPAYLTNRCIKVNSIVNGYNSLLAKYKNYARKQNDIDNSKLLIADQLKGVSNILKSLALETKKEVNFNYKLQEKIKESLIYNNIVPIDVICLEQDLKTNVVELFIRNIDFDVEKIKEVLNNIYKTKMVVEKFNVLNNGSSVCVKFVTAPIYDMGIGVCQKPKGGEDACGDTFTSIKLKNNKFLFGVCDGMGHGEGAHRTSEIAINLIENFYKAGFDNQTILTSVNSLLSIQQNETFSALDVGVVDLKTGEINFIKQGATSSYILSPTKIFKIESSGLPLGILSEIKPKVVKTVLTPEDFVVIVSDGIIDSFSGEQNFEEFLQSLHSKNPQELAERILNKAYKNTKNYPNDDITVLAGKLFYY